MPHPLLPSPSPSLTACHSRYHILLVLASHMPNSSPDTPADLLVIASAASTIVVDIKTGPIGAPVDLSPLVEACSCTQVASPGAATAVVARGMRPPAVGEGAAARSSTASVRAVRCAAPPAFVLAVGPRAGVAQARALVWPVRGERRPFGALGSSGRPWGS